ncbi:acyl-[acyl-carrier-protein] thioesterase [Pelotomaculum propionicicum]|uniref:acyl-[acyl-carrier-protein] thioesterase n=1 Tax=Pelotomaculum propionicicum TaxID=258475 RepID=UPI003B7B2FB7
MSTFTINNRVHYYEINSQRLASPVTVLNFFEEVAARQSEECGYGLGKLMSQGQIWILTNWSIQMERYPGWMEDVIVETKVCSFERFYAYREFKIRDKNKMILGTADSRWIFYDLKRNRPVRVPPDIAVVFGVDGMQAAGGRFPEIESAESCEQKLEFMVRLSDIDMYRHVNNTRYVEWMLEAVPVDVHREYLPVKIEVAYKKETVYGSRVISCAAQKQRDDGGIEFLHQVTDKITGAELARAATQWKRVE